MESSCNITSCKWCFSHSWHTTQSTYLCSMDLSSSQFLLWAWASYAMHFRLSKAFSLSWWMHLRDWSMLFHTVDGAYQTSLFIIWSSQPFKSRRWKSENSDIVVCSPLHTTILILVSRPSNLQLKTKGHLSALQQGHSYHSPMVPWKQTLSIPVSYGTRAHLIQWEWRIQSWNWCQASTTSMSIVDGRMSQAILLSLIPPYSKTQ